MQVIHQSARSDCAPRVTHVVISLAHGGAEKLVVEWTNARNERLPGSTRIVCLDGAGDLAPQVSGSAVTALVARRERFPWDAGAVKRLRTMLGQTGRFASVVHTHSVAAQQYAVLASLGLRVGRVHTQHGPFTHELSRVDRLRSRLLCRLSHHVVAVSEATAQAMAAMQGIPRSRIEVVPNGVQLSAAKSGSDAQRATQRRELAIPAESFVIGSVGRLEAVKGYDRLLRAFAAICPQPKTAGAQWRDIRLLLVGDGSERLCLEQQAVSLGIADRTSFVGFQPDVQPFLSAMDLFVLPSRSEGLSVALLEAMAAGRAVAVTAVGESPEVVARGAAGFLLPDDERTWPEFFWGLISRPAAVHDAAIRGLERAATAYSFGRTMMRYEEIYASCC